MRGLALVAVFGLAASTVTLGSIGSTPVHAIASDAAPGASLYEPVDQHTVEAFSDGDASIDFRAGHIELVVHPAVGPHPSAEELSQLAPEFGCSLNVQHVHGSTHFSGTINGVAKVQCNVAAGSFALHYSLIRVSPNYTQWGAGSKYNTGKSWIKNNRAVDCDQGPGVFQGWAQGVLSPPPGYVLSGPPIHSRWGEAQPVACGISLLASAPAAVSESMTITFIRADLME